MLSLYYYWYITVISDSVSIYFSSLFKVLKEVKPLVWIFVLQNLPELAYFIYLLYTVSLETPIYLRSCLHPGHHSVKDCISVHIVQPQLQQKIHLCRSVWTVRNPFFFPRRSFLSGARVKHTYWRLRL